MGKLNKGIRACGVFLLWAATAIALPAQTYTTLYSFDSTDGSFPSAGLIQGTDGNFYGTTYFGGAFGGLNTGGTVFKITPSGALTTLYNFCSQSSCTDGELPYAGLVQGTDGNFYGTTQYGGANSLCTLNGYIGCGTIFKITPNGALTTLYSFCPQSGCVDGEIPKAALLQAANGSFYGMTEYGGASSICGPSGCGTIFKITPSGAFTTVYNFGSQTNGTDGIGPESALIQATDGNLYGTTPGGGAEGAGTVFKTTPNGTLTTLYSFCSPTKPCRGPYSPLAGLVQATDGNFYGTTFAGGNEDHGAVFKITPSGTLTILYAFRGTYYPFAALIQATDGNLYGTTYQGGSGSAGIVFKITPSGALTILYRFEGSPGGALPIAGLLQDTDGTFYGTTTSGGANGSYGAVYSLSVGLGPFAETNPTSGIVGAAVNILGYDLTYATSVTFDGTPAVFTIVSNWLITTTVPAGAHTGKVHVSTTQGNLSSNVVFTVLP